MLRKIALVAILLICLASYAGAQTSVGRISGAVTDRTGAVVPGASIIVINEDTGIRWPVTTDASGYYVAPNLPVGNYTVQAELVGFKKAQKTGYALDSDSRLTANFVLQVGELSQKVEVIEVAGETVNTTSGEIGRVIDSAQVEATALNGRNYMQLVTLIPGVAVLDEDQMALTTSLSTASQSVNGNRSNSNSLTVDGAFNMDAGNNATQVNNVGVDFIREVKIQTSNFSAEYGRMSGAAINVVTRGGENNYHGSLFEFLRNDFVDARNYLAPNVGKLDFNDFGWNAGGPVKKNKLFFFGGQEYKIIRRAAEPVRFSIPTRAQRAGDFSAGSTKLYYPGTTNQIPNKNMASLITPDGRATAAVFTAMEKQAVAYNDAVTSSNSTFQGNNPFNSREDLVRVDYRMSDRHTFYARWLKDSYDLSDPFGGDNSKLPVTATKQIRPGGSAQLAHTMVVSPTLINEAKFNALTLRDNITPTGTSWKRSTYGFTYQKYYSGGGGAYPDGIPSIQVNGLSYFNGPAGAAQSAFTDLSVADNLTWVHGKHTFKAGVLITRDRKDQNGKALYNGQAKVNNKGNPNSTGIAFADALVGCFLTYTEAQTDPVAFLRFTQAESYAMDTWRVARRLSVEAGVRYYFIQPTHAQANNLVNFSPSLYDPRKAVQVNQDGTLVPNSGFTYNGLVRAGDGVPASQVSRVPGSDSPDVRSVPAGAPPGFFSAAGAFAPRFGFAYSPFGDKTTIRGGFGMYYNRPETSLISPMMNVPPYLQTVQLTNGFLANLGGATAAAPAPIANISAINPNLKTTYAMNFSLSVQRQFPRGVFADLAYVGNLGHHLLRQPDINTPSFANYQIIASYPTASRPSVNAYRPYLGFSQINMRLSDSNSNYNALQAYMTKRKGDLMMTASYTWSKALADSSTNSENPEDPFNKRFNYGPTTYDRRQIFVATFNYSVPLFRRRRDFLGAAFGGWELSGVTRAQTGPQLSVTEDGITGVMRADYLGGPVALPSDQRSADHWFNTAAFVTSPETRRGNTGMGIVTGPGLYTWDTSLRKSLRLTERLRLRFQADSTNLMNHANFRNLQAKISNKQYGQVTQCGPARNLQFGLKLMF